MVAARRRPAPSTRTGTCRARSSSTWTPTSPGRPGAGGRGTRCPTRDAAGRAAPLGRARRSPRRGVRRGRRPRRPAPPPGPGGSCAGPGIRDVQVLDGGYAAWVGRRPPGHDRDGAESPRGDVTVAPAAMPVLDAAGAAALAARRRAARRPGAGAVPGRGGADRPGRRAHPGRASTCRSPRQSARTAGCRPPAELATGFAAVGATGRAGRRVLRLRRHRGADRARADRGRAYDAGAVRRLVERLDHRPGRPVATGDRRTASMSAACVWDDALLGYDLGDHPLDPVRRGADHRAGPRARRARPRPAYAWSAARRPTDAELLTRCTRRSTSTWSRPRRRTRPSPGYGFEHARQPGLRRHARGERAGRRRHRCGRPRRSGAARPARGEHRRRAAPRDAGPGVRLLRLQRPGGGDRPACWTSAPSGSRTSTSTCITATGCRRSSTTTRGC